VATTVGRLAGGAPVIDMVNVGHFSLEDAGAAMAVGMAIAWLTSDRSAAVEAEGYASA
jgi:hypothetical protein